jgi:hypothetical protein
VLFICNSLVTVYSPKKIEQNKVSLKAFVRLNLNYFIHVKQCDTEAGRLDDQDRRVSANPPIVASFGYATSLNYWTPVSPGHAVWWQLAGTGY